MNEKEELVVKWNEMEGDQRLRLDYPLDENSVAFDVGTYKGEWLDSIYNRYHCKVYAFEPVISYYEDVCKRYLENDKIKIFNYGLFNKDTTLDIVSGKNDDSASIFVKEGSKKETIQLRDSVGVLKELGISYIDLMKINVEGAEYGILESLIAGGFHKIIGNIQVQFHELANNYSKRRDEIRSALSITHKETYNVPFVWENWAIK